MKPRLQKSIEYIKGYCDKHDRCSFCKLQDKNTGDCILQKTIPSDWQFKAESEEQ